MCCRLLELVAQFIIWNLGFGIFSLHHLRLLLDALCDAIHTVARKILLSTLFDAFAPRFFQHLACLELRAWAKPAAQET